KEQYAALRDLYGLWNERINVISRKDIDNLYTHHVLHSLGIAKVQPFMPECDILDVGTGGGFPGIPLAIMFPQTHFHLVDSIGKKIKVVEAVASELGLANVRAEQTRAENIQGEYDFVVSRAVTDLPTFVGWVRCKISSSNYHDLRNGILYLKGGDLTEEIKPFASTAKVFELSDFFDDEFFETKKVVYLPIKARKR
ncbi:MAG: 16S rRNA (guanine(527)-N(7))-methyltransferase RsmG, partial [Bacteroidales bacterium]|nr:16S rRNA (guanine(527)-N(7))-methyltransferase RsmG [Bacteroidales bacterium]